MKAQEHEIRTLKGSFEKEIKNLKSALDELMAQSKDSSQALKQNLESLQAVQSQVEKIPNSIGASGEVVSRPKKNVFFDLGANKGDSVEQFVGLSVSGLGGVASQSIVRIPKKIPGDWDVWMFEVHPIFTERLIKLKDKVEHLSVAEYGGPFHVFLNNNTAIGTTDGVIDIYLDTKSSEIWGSSILKEHPDTNGTTIKVPVKDLTKLIMTNYRVDDYIIVKMDIEGAEFDLMQDLLVRGTFQYIDELYVEYHTNIDKNGIKPCLIALLNYAKKYMHIGNWQ
eukprot:Phypoly_transcript_15462.p1 GENE.Phypoly_transcript_15462~~Phypoly_transcript_15462.p1  ORF type:complete len:303 (+),score=48.08 Phypoly_transcript_15462:67-909(+)